MLLMLITSRSGPMNLWVILIMPKATTCSIICGSSNLVPKAWHVAETREYRRMVRYTRAYGLFMKPVFGNVLRIPGALLTSLRQRSCGHFSLQ
jgi:hypothetical protein